jgi:hypothetical protein
VIEILQITHVLLLVTWLGVDSGVFIGSFVWTRPGMSVEARRAVRSLTQVLDLGPRLSLVVFVPAGTALAYSVGLGFAGVPQSIAWPAITVLFLLAVCWCWLVVQQFRLRVRGGTDRWIVRRYPQIDRGVRLSLIAAALGSGIPSYWTAWPWASHTIATKVVLFGVILAASLRIRAAAVAYAPIWEEIQSDGETPERIQRLRDAMSRVRTAVVMVYIGLLAIVTVAYVRVP